MFANRYQQYCIGHYDLKYQYFKNIGKTLRNLMGSLIKGKSLLTIGLVLVQYRVVSCTNMTFFSLIQLS